jgi:hypothetical protein
MKKRILIWISCAILSLGLCSCGTDTGGADTLTSEPSNEVSTEIQETKLSIWDRSESDIMSSIKERFADQDVFDGTFSIVESTDETVGTLYAIFKDGTYTYTGFSFMEEKDSGREKLTLMSIDYNSDGALEAFFLGAGATLMEGDTEGRYQSLSQAVDAFRTEFKDLSSSNTSVEIGDIEYVFGISGSFVMLGMNQVTSDAATSSTSGNSTSRSDNSTDSKGDSDDSTASSQ